MADFVEVDGVRLRVVTDRATMAALVRDSDDEELDGDILCSTRTVARSDGPDQLEAVAFVDVRAHIGRANGELLSNCAELADWLARAFVMKTCTTPSFDHVARLSCSIGAEILKGVRDALP